MPLLWSYGVTTVEERRRTLLPRTLESLCRAGFGDPRLFVDGSSDQGGYEREFGLPVTTHALAPGWGSLRRPVGFRTAANWHASLLELYLRCPRADRYMIVQDDVVCPLGLRDYLDAVPYPTGGAYLNLFTFPPQHRVGGSRVWQAAPPSPDFVGWYPARRREKDGGPTGMSACALAFDRETTVKLLSSRYLVERHQCPLRGHHSIDGGISEAMDKEGVREYVHSPSLVQHTGHESSRPEQKGKGAYPVAESFRGEEFDLRELLRK